MDAFDVSTPQKERQLLSTIQPCCHLGFQESFPKASCFKCTLSRPYYSHISSFPQKKYIRFRHSLKPSLVPTIKQYLFLMWLYHGTKTSVSLNLVGTENLHHRGGNNPFLPIFPNAHEHYSSVLISWLTGSSVPYTYCFKQLNRFMFKI